VSSRLLEYEAWTRLRAAGLAESHGDLLRDALGRIAFLEMVGPVLETATGLLPGPLRTLDALHLASALFLRDQGARPRLATYDLRLAAGARRMEIPVVDLP
jgi:predicted nucleic acid-binding protein